MADDLTNETQQEESNVNEEQPVFSFELPPVAESYDEQTEESENAPIIEENEKELILLTSSYENEDEIVNKPIIEEKQQELILTEEDALKNQDEENKDIEEEEVDLSFLNLNKKVDIEEEDVPTKVEVEEVNFIAEPTNTKFCDNCGIMLTDESSICPSCGEPID